jgi:hypothetical protein
MHNSELHDGLIEIGIPQINFDQLNNHCSFQHTHISGRWFAKLPFWFYEITDKGDNNNHFTATNKLKLSILHIQADWPDWPQIDLN